MPGMPEMPKIRGMESMNAPTRTLTMNLTSDRKADASSKAQCTIPAGLKLGPKVDLVIDLPQEVNETGRSTDDKPELGKTTEFKMKMYWGCSETVPPSQPRVIDSKEMTGAAQQAMAQKNHKTWKRAMSAYTDGSHAYWPGPNAKPIVKDATCPGDYQLTTNYVGGTSITFDKPQDFLAPIEFVSPKKVDLSEAIRVEWKSVPNAAAYLLNAFSGNDKEMIMWTSSLVPDASQDLEHKALSAEQLETLLKNGVLIPADKTFCYIPKGIFKASGNPTISIIAIGKDKIQTKDGIETNVIVRSTAIMMMGEGMGGFEGDGPDEDDKRVIKDNKNAGDDDSGNVVEETNDTLDKANGTMDDVDGTKSTGDKVKGTLKRAKDLFKHK